MKTSQGVTRNVTMEEGLILNPLLPMSIIIIMPMCPKKDSQVNLIMEVKINLSVNRFITIELNLIRFMKKRPTRMNVKM